MTASIDARRARKDARAAVVFVHGFSGHIHDTWGRFPEFVLGDGDLTEWDAWMLGYPTGLRIDLLGLWAADPGLDKLALRLVTDITHGSLKQYGAIALVAHSMGGLVVQRALLESDELRGRVSHVLLCGTPSGGLIKAGLVRWLKPQFRHMAAGGSFIRTLRTDWTRRFGSRPVFRFLAAAGERDEFVPASSCLGPFHAGAGAGPVAVIPGNHVEMVKPDRPDDLCVKLLTGFLKGEAESTGPSNSAKVAVELGDFQAAIEQLLPSAQELDSASTVHLAIALDGVGRRQEAIEVLRLAAQSSTDAMGTLAGRYKRRWLAERRLADGESALSLYRKAFEEAEAGRDLEQMYYLGINVAFMSYAFLGDLSSARAAAEKVLAHCQAAAVGEEPTDARRWRLATEGEAKLLLGSYDEAIECYRNAVGIGQPSPWKLASMYHQAAWIVRQREDAALLRRLKTVFTG